MVHSNITTVILHWNSACISEISLMSCVTPGQLSPPGAFNMTCQNHQEIRVKNASVGQSAISCSTGDKPSTLDCPVMLTADVRQQCHKRKTCSPSIQIPPSDQFGSCFDSGRYTYLRVWYQCYPGIPFFEGNSPRTTWNHILTISTHYEKPQGLFFTNMSWSRSVGLYHTTAHS